MTTNLTDELVQAIQSWFDDMFGSTEAAQQAYQNTEASLLDHGINPADLVGANLGQYAAQCGAASGLPQSAKQDLQSYGGGGGGYAAKPPQSVNDVVQQIQQIQQVAYHYHDESVKTTIFGDNYGNVVSNTGDDSNVAGGDQNVAEGEGAQVIDDTYGDVQANTGDGAIQAGGNVSGANTGVNTGVIAGDDAVVGDDNQVLDIEGSADGAVFGDNTGVAGGLNVNSGGGAGGAGGAGTGGAGGDFGSGGAGTGGAGGAGGAGGDVNINFGGGSQTNVQDSNLSESAVGSGGDTTNYAEDTTVHAVDSTVNTEQGPGDQAVTLPAPEPEPAPEAPPTQEPIL